MRTVDSRQNYSLQFKLLAVFVGTSVLLAAINVFLYFNLQNTIAKIDTVYVSNEELNDLSGCLENVQEKMFEYLATKTSESLEDYYRYEQNYDVLLKNLNRDTVENVVLMQEKNIYNMSQSYLEITEEAVSAKRAGNIEKYNKEFEEGTELYEKIQNLIWDLNNSQLQVNSENYRVFRETLNNLVAICASVLVVILIANIFFIIIMTRSITKPIKHLAEAADKVAAGQFDITVPYAETKDELGVTARAFNKMVESIRNYIEQTKEHYEQENRLRENELRMQSELQDAQLKYLQAQINPHFLFNTLNAGAQLAMMEDAEKTCLFVENMAEFFRYNVQKIEADTTLREEIELVDNYLYILNVRFSGEIHYEKQLDRKLLSARIPSMILQPIVENAVNHGIRGVEWEGHIWLTVYQEPDNICISVRDNGYGMDAQTIQKVLHGEQVYSEEEKDSAGIGMDNVISRMRRFFGKEDVIQIVSEGPGKGTEVILFVPVSAENIMEK